MIDKKNDVAEPIAVTPILSKMLDWLNEFSDPAVPKGHVRTLIHRIIDDFEQLSSTERNRDKLRFKLLDDILLLERWLGEPAYQFITAISEYYDYERDTLRRMLYVAQLFPPELRKPDLPFSYYRRIAESDLGTREFRERQARAHFILEIVYNLYKNRDPYDEHKISNWRVFQQVVQIACEQNGWINKTQVVPKEPEVIDVPFTIEAESNGGASPVATIVPIDLSIGASSEIQQVPFILNFRDRASGARRIELIFRFGNQVELTEAVHSWIPEIVALLGEHGYSLISDND